MKLIKKDTPLNELEWFCSGYVRDVYGDIFNADNPVKKHSFQVVVEHLNGYVRVYNYKGIYRSKIQKDQPILFTFLADENKGIYKILHIFN